MLRTSAAAITHQVFLDLPATTMHQLLKVSVLCRVSRSSEVAKLFYQFPVIPKRETHGGTKSFSTKILVQTYATSLWIQFLPVWSGLTHGIIHSSFNKVQDIGTLICYQTTKWWPRQERLSSDALTITPFRHWLCFDLTSLFKPWIVCGGGFRQPDLSPVRHQED